MNLAQQLKDEGRLEGKQEGKQKVLLTLVGTAPELLGEHRDAIKQATTPEEMDRIEKAVMRDLKRVLKS